MSGDDKQVYLTEETWSVVKDLHQSVVEGEGDAEVFLRLLISIALARGLDVGDDQISERTTHYQLDKVAPMKYLVQWRYPDEERPYRCMSRLAHAGALYVRNTAAELDGNIPFLEIVSERVEVDVAPWMNLPPTDLES